MKSLVKNIRDYFNRRTRAVDSSKEAHVNRQTLVLQNGESASRLLRNEDFALMFNLYRFNMLELLEDSKEDSERIGNAYYVAGVRDFITFIEKSEYLAKKLEKSKLNEMV
jgi:hypothetical protein